MRYERILAALLAEPLAMHPASAEWLFSLRKLPEAEIQAKLAAATRGRSSRASGPAVVHIRGSIVREPNFWTEMGFATSAEDVGRQIDSLAADAGVPAIVLDIDSPGGTVSGTPELAARVAAAATQKKVIAAVTGTYAASAAYYVASQASELVVSPGSEVGSIGVVMMHVDESEYLKQLGVKVSFVAAGAQKVAGNPFAPLDDAARAEYQRRVDDSYQDFVRAVAVGRGVTQTRVREEWGARIFPAREAVRLGLADRIGTIDDVLTRLGGAGQGGGGRAESPAQPDRSAVQIRRRRMRMG
jgi:signal peptide peptidase SppA